MTKSMAKHWLKLPILSLIWLSFCSPILSLSLLFYLSICWIVTTKWIGQIFTNLNSSFVLWFTTILSALWQKCVTKYTEIKWIPWIPVTSDFTHLSQLKITFLWDYPVQSSSFTWWSSFNRYQSTEWSSITHFYSEHWIKLDCINLDLRFLIYSLFSFLTSITQRIGTC